MSERIWQYFPVCGKYLSRSSTDQQDIFFSVADRMVAREKKLHELEVLLANNLQKDRKVKNRTWTIKDGFAPAEADKMLLLTATERMVKRVLYHSNRTQSVTIINPNTQSERKYWKVAHGHCGCIFSEQRKTGERWPSEVDAQTECGSKI